jgi:hypothetical protein
MSIAIKVLNDIDTLSINDSVADDDHAFPRDYQFLIQEFGACQIIHHHLVITIADLIKGYPQDFITDIRESMIEANRHVPSVYPPLHPLHQGSYGILPVGCDNEGHIFGWVANGRCANWTMFIDNRNELKHYSVGLIRMLISNMQSNNVFRFWDLDITSETSIVSLTLG